MHKNCDAVKNEVNRKMVMELLKGGPPVLRKIKWNFSQTAQRIRIIIYFY